MAYFNNRGEELVATILSDLRKYVGTRTYGDTVKVSLQDEDGWDEMYTIRRDLAREFEGENRLERAAKHAARLVEWVCTGEVHTVAQDYGYPINLKVLISGHGVFGLVYVYGHTARTKFSANKDEIWEIY